MVEPSSDPVEILTKAEKLKEEGNSLFRSGEYLESIKRYAKISLYINGLVSNKDSLAQYARNHITEDQSTQVEDLKFTANSNMSAAYLQLKNYSKAIQKANIALSIRENSKALYRRALAYIEIGDIDNATIDLERASALMPNDNAILNAQSKLQSKRLEVLSLEKKKYKGFFDKLNNE